MHIAYDRSTYLENLAQLMFDSIRNTNFNPLRCVDTGDLELDEEFRGLDFVEDRSTPVALEDQRNGNEFIQYRKGRGRFEESGGKKRKRTLTPASTAR